MKNVINKTMIQISYINIYNENRKLIYNENNLAEIGYDIVQINKFIWWIK